MSTMRWGEWQGQGGQRVRPGLVNGQATCWQWLHENGNISDKNGKFLSESEARYIIKATPRYDPPQSLTDRPTSKSTASNYQLGGQYGIVGGSHIPVAGEFDYSYPPSTDIPADRHATVPESAPHVLPHKQTDINTSSNTASLERDLNRPIPAANPSYQSTSGVPSNYPEFVSDPTKGKSLFPVAPKEATSGGKSAKIPGKSNHDARILHKRTVVSQQKSLEPARHAERDSDNSTNRKSTATDKRSAQPSVDIDGRQVPLIAASDAPPGETARSKEFAGRTYYYNRDQKIIAVAVSDPRQRRRSETVDDATRNLESMNVNDREEDDFVTPLGHRRPLAASRASDRRGSGSNWSKSAKDPPKGEVQHQEGKPRSAQGAARPKSQDGPDDPPISKQYQIKEGLKGIKGGGKGEFEELDPAYVVRSSPFYQKGRVFAMLWHESSGGKHATDIGEPEGRQYHDGRFNIRIYTTIRRMVVMQTCPGYSLCSPILTYNNQGVTKSGIRESEAKKHTAIYMDDKRPFVDPAELDKGMDKQPIAVRASKSDQKLWPMSRLNFGKIYAVEHNCKAMDVGRILGTDLRNLEIYHYNTLHRRQGDEN